MQVTQAVHRFGSRFVNWYLLEDGRALTVINAGLLGQWRGLGFRLHDVEAIAAGLRAEQWVVRRIGGSSLDVTPRCISSTCAVGNLIACRDDNHLSTIYTTWLHDLASPRAWRRHPGNPPWRPSPARRHPGVESGFTRCPKGQSPLRI